MSGLRDRCPGCSRRLIITRFDTTFRLSDRTLALLATLREPVDVVSFFEQDHELYDDVRSLLKE